MQLSNFITKIIFTTAFFSTFLAFMISIIFQYKNYESDKLHIREEFTSLKKEQIKREVLSVYNLIEHKEDILTNRIKEKLQERAAQAHNLAMNIYTQNKDTKSKDDIELLIARAINNINYENDTTYFFINSNKGQAILFNKNITLDSYKDVWNLKDANNNFIIQNQAKIALENKEGFLLNTFVKPDSNDFKQYSKISYVKLFEPFDWHIGMGEYTDDIRTTAQNEILDLIAGIRFGENNYLFVNTLDAQTLVFDGRKIEVPTTHPYKNLFEQQLNAVQNSDGGFFSYKFKKINTTKEFDKISYVKKYEKYNWIIGCGVYLDEVEKELARKEAIFKETIYQQLIYMLVMFILIIIALYLTSKKISKFIDININHLISSFEKASKENKKIDTQNLTYKEFVSLANNLNITLENKNETEKKLNDYIKIINENIIISSTNKDGYITDVSEAFCKISGYTKEELLGKTHRIVRHPDIPDKFYKDIWQKILSGNIWEGELKNKNKQGRDYWVYVIIKPIFKDLQIIGFTAIKTNITDKKYIEQQSITDDLTQLFNRRFFNIKFIEEINRAKRENNYFSFLIMDIDYFKEYNDNYGHQKGDLALERVSNLLKKKATRASDFAFRLGGEEFGIITTLDKEKAIEFANLIKNEVENLKIEHKASKISKYLTISIGIISKEGENITNSDLLYKEADDNLYEAKRLGRNSIFIL
ncbi:MAG: cache domain-containing protein [Aliarcobacter sp.]|nr:cache domain-containing protein [Aliarcobacter sp.]